MAEGLWFNIGVDNTQFNQKAKETNSALSKMSENVKAFTSGLKASFTEAAKSMAGFYAVAKAGTMFQDLIAQNDQFNKSMKEVGTLSEEVAQNLESYKKQVLDLTSQIPIAANDAAQALYQINSAGHTGADGMKVLEVSAKAAIGGVTDTATAADAITTVLNAYKMSADDASKISDKLFTAVRLGKTTMGELGSTISTVAPLAASYGVSIDEVLAAVASLTKQGTATGEAFTNIRSAIISMGDALGSTYFQTHTLQEGLLAMREAFPDNNKLKDTMGRIQGVQAVLGMTGENAKSAASDLDEFTKSAGAASDAYDKMNTGKGSETTKLQNNILKEMSTLNDQISGVIAKVAHTMNEMFDSGEIEDYVDAVKELVVTYGAYKAAAILCTATQKAYNVVMEEYRYQVALANVGTKTYVTLQKFQKAETVAVTAAQAAQSTVLGLLSRAWQTLTLSMAKNPLGWAALAATALAFAIYKVIEAGKEESEHLKGLTGDLDKYGRSTEEAAQANEELSSTYKDTAGQLVEMTAKLSSFKGNKEDEKKLVEECNNKYGDAMGYYESVSDWYKVLTANSEAYCEQMIVETETRQYANQIAENDQKINDIKYNKDGSIKTYNTQRNHTLQADRYGNMTWVEVAGTSDQEIASKDLSNLRKANDNLRKQMQAKLKEAAELQKKLKTSIEGTNRVKEPSKNTKVDIKDPEAEKAAKKAAEEAAKKAKENADIREKSAEEQVKWDSQIERQQREAGYAAEEAYIAGMKEGGLKRLRQLDLDHKKQMDAIEDQAVEMKKAVYEHNKTVWDNNNKDNGKTYTDTEEGKAGWQGIQLNGVQAGTIANLKYTEVQAYNKATKDIVDAETKAQNEYLIKYGLFQEKKMALKDKYDALIEKEETEYGKMALKKEFKEADNQLDVTEFKKNVNWDVIFGNLDGLDKVSLEHVKAQLQQFIDTADNLQPSDIKDLQEAMQNLDEHINMTNVIKAFRTTRKELEDAKNEVITAQRELRNAQNDQGFAQSNLDLANKHVEQAGKEKTEAYTSGDINKIADAEWKYAKAVQERDKAQAKVKNTTRKVADAETNLQNKQEKRIKTDSKAKKSAANLRAGLGELANQMSSLGSTIGGTAGEVLQFGSSAIGVFNVTSEGIETIKRDMISLESAVAVLAIIQAAFTAISEAANLLGLGVDSEAEKAEKLKDQYEGMKEIWDELIDKKQEYINISYGSEAKDAYEEANKYLKNEEEAARVNAAQRLQVSNGGHSMGYRMWAGSYKYDNMNWKDVAGTISSALGVGISSMRSFTTLTADQLQWIKENYVGLWDAMDDDFRTYLEDIIEAGDTADTLKESLQEAVTGVTFDDFYDDFVSTLSDMDSSAKDMTDNFESYLQNAILQSLMANKYKSKIEALYNGWVSASDSDGNGILDLTADESEKLKESEKALAEEMIAERDAMAEAYGWGQTESEASSKGFEGMSQDTGDELNGRFAALQISNEILSISVTEISSKMDILASRRDAYLNDILQAHALTNSWLESTYNMNRQMFGRWDEFFTNINKNLANL